MHFLEHLSLGQYVPAKSFIHSLDPRSKVLAVMFLITSVFLANTTLWPYVIWFVLIVIISALSNISFKTVVTSTRPVLILILFTLAINLFFADGRECSDSLHFNYRGRSRRNLNGPKAFT